MSEYITRADFWQETTDTEGVVPAGCPTRVEAQDGTAWEDVSKHDRLIGGWLRTQRVFIDSRWTPPAPPLNVGCSISNETRLEKLPDGSVVIDNFGNAWQGRTDRSCATKLIWMLVGFTFGESSELLLQRFGPVTLIYLPEGEN